MKPLVLGTAQWGLDYGVTNSSGRLSEGALREIVGMSKKLGVRQLDTAPGYGDAEQRISPWAAEFQITTKVMGRSGIPVPYQLSESLTRLGVSTVDRCLVHDWPSLTAGQREEVVRGLMNAREQGLISTAGVSGYTEQDLVLAALFGDELGVAQVPVNILDQRLDGSAVVDELRSRGWIIQARSVFLQGLLADPVSSIRDTHDAVGAVFEAADRRDMTPRELALAYVQSRDWVDELVVGVTSALELKEVVMALGYVMEFAPKWETFATDDLELIDPRRWTAT